MGEDDDREIQVRTCKGQVILAFGRRHDAGQQVELVIFRLFEHGGPVFRLDQLDPHAQAVLDQAYIVGCEALITAIFITVFEGRPRSVHPQAQLLMVRQPATLIISKSQRASRCGPGEQRQQYHGRQSGHNGLVMARGMFRV